MNYLGSKKGPKITHVGRKKLHILFHSKNPKTFPICLSSFIFFFSSVASCYTNWAITMTHKSDINQSMVTKLAAKIPVTRISNNMFTSRTDSYVVFQSLKVYFIFRRAQIYVLKFFQTICKLTVWGLFELLRAVLNVLDNH